MNIDLLKGWTVSNKKRLYKKMQKLGVNQGGIFSSTRENVALFDQLAKQLRQR